jgi:hypothetical protein
MIIAILVCLFVSIILQAMEVYNLCGKNVPCVEGEGEEEKIKIKKYKSIIAYGSKIL